MSEMQARLVSDRAEIAGRVAALRGDVDSIIDSGGATTGDDEHDSEGATIGVQRVQAQALLDQADAHLHEIDAALQRVADGSYGTCVRCGKAISAERLDARPEAAKCITCASRRMP